MTSGIRVLVALAAVLSILAAGTASAAPRDEARVEHERVIDFWTHERVARAMPRDFVFDPGRGFIQIAKPDNPGNGNGKGGGGDGGDGDSNLVTGASWATGGLVAQTTGKVLFAMGTSYYVCSASVVADPDGLGDDDSLILTAAHCAYDESNREFATNWVFIPAYDEAPAPLSTDQSRYCPDTRYGCWTATALTVHDGYASAGGFNSTAVVHDFAVATVYSGGLTGTELEDTVGSQTIHFASVTTDTAYAFGYPAAQKYKGDDLVYCAGPVGTDPNMDDATYRIECDMTGGSSGGPWFSPFQDDAGTLSSVNSYGYRGDSGMYGPKFNTDTDLVYTSADDATANKVVGGGP